MFYDGSYFSITSNYFAYNHPRRARLSISGLHDFIRHEIAKEENSDYRYAQIVEAHLFRGRFSAQQTLEKDMLFKERIFDDILMRENIVSHHLPMVGAGNQGSGFEKGIDVWLALETYEIAQIKNLDVVVLVAGDSDYLPLIRKLHALSVRTMVLGFTFSFTADNGEERGTRVSQLLMNEASYPVNMSEFIDNMDTLPASEQEKYSDLFVRRRDYPSQEQAHEALESAAKSEEPEIEWKEGTIVNLLEGFGFIKPSDGGENLFFHHTALTTSDFADLFKGMEVSFVEGMGQRGICAVQVRTFY